MGKAYAKLFSFLSLYQNQRLVYNHVSPVQTQFSCMCHFGLDCAVLQSRCLMQITLCPAQAWPNVLAGPQRHRRSWLTAWRAHPSRQAVKAARRNCLLGSKIRSEKCAVQYWPIVILQDVSVGFVSTEHKVPLAAPLH